MSTNVNFQKFTAEQLGFMVALANPKNPWTQEEIAESLAILGTVLVGTGLKRDLPLSRWTGTTRERLDVSLRGHLVTQQQNKKPQQ